MRQSKKHSPPGQQQHTFLVKVQVFVQLTSSCIWLLSSEEPKCQLIMRLQCGRILGANSASICFPKKEGGCAVPDIAACTYPHPERCNGSLLIKSKLESDLKLWQDGCESRPRSMWTSLAEPAVLIPHSFDWDFHWKRRSFFCYIWKTEHVLHHAAALAVQNAFPIRNKHKFLISLQLKMSLKRTLRCLPLPPLVLRKFNKRKTQLKLLGCFNSLQFSNISQTSRNKGSCLMFILTEKASFRPCCKLEKSTGTAIFPRSRSCPMLLSSAAMAFPRPGLSSPRAKGWEGRSYLVGAPWELPQHSGSLWPCWKKGGFLIWKLTLVSQIRLQTLTSQRLLGRRTEQDVCMCPGHAGRDGGRG